MQRPVALQRPVLAHQPLRPLAAHLPAQIARGERGDHPGPVGRVLPRDRKDPDVDPVKWPALPGRWPGGTAVDGLPADAGDARHDRGRATGSNQLAQTGRRAQSLPAPQEFPRTLQLQRLLAQRPLEPGDLAAQLIGLGALGLAR